MMLISKKSIFLLMVLFTLSKVKANTTLPIAHTTILAPVGQVNLNTALLVLAPGMSGPEIKASEMLLDEVEKRSRIRWQTRTTIPAKGQKAVILGQRKALISAYPSLAKVLGNGSEKPEGFRIVSYSEDVIVIAGNDARGVLFGAGKLLRMMDYTWGAVTVASKIDVNSAPVYALRGHQLGYRPKTNSYDGWSVSIWEQYIRDLVIFGTNAIELIPPVSDDDADSPHFPIPPMKMMIEMSRLAKEYGIACWVWYPAMEKDYGDKATVDRAIKEWGAVLEQLPRVDAVFVPGGDPGHTPPKDFFPMLEKQTAQLKKLHPEAKMWMSPQGFGSTWLADFYKVIKTEPEWLEGVVFGPQQSESLDDLRANLPARYKLRFYPDITHSWRAQYPVPEWDFASIATLNREPINPRPIDQALIFKRLQPVASYGFLTYSEGCNDDVNKIIWSGLGWDPNADVTDILREYSGYFIGSELRESFAQGLKGLEQNWRGSLAQNTQVRTTLSQFQDMERSATPARLQNWRFQQALYRAYYDATNQSRLIQETAQEQKALEILSRASATGSLAALADARVALEKPAPLYASETRARVFELAEALFQSIHMQLSVARYQAIAVHRGANLDLIDFPLNDAPWLRKRFDEISGLKTEQERLKRIEAILNWTNPGPGGFYDDLGKPGAQPHLVMGSAYADDPAYLKAPMDGMVVRVQDHESKVSSSTFAETLHDYPLELFYPSLDKSAHYKLKVVYGPEAKSDIRLVANEGIEIQPMKAKAMDFQPQEFEIPAVATQGGSLKLKWNRPLGLGGSGRGVQIAEVWLMRVN
ncbi:hypothetical protein [Pedobacter duraquae]|uniref:Glycosyl hydrolase family 67 n=1 Tax=Pedobacter duraquae TaxID=425511 RepID=A0A4R6IKE7_9SPHI|nr:hypothetical protein [Pedobacter duraquae]TDO22532.1 hypothetical protein CLV32_1507 [Pedobacter duraquae]